MTIDPNKPIPPALFDLRPLVGPVAWSLLTALIENEYQDAKPLSIGRLADMTGLDGEEACALLCSMANNAFIPVTIYFEVESGGKFRLNLNKLSRILKDGETRELKEWAS